MKSILLGLIRPVQGPLLGINRDGRSVPPLLGIRLRDWLLGIDSHEPTVGNGLLVLDDADCTVCGSSSTILKTQYTIRIPSHLASTLYYLQCKSCGKYFHFLGAAGRVSVSRR